ncbi:MAG: hypothetical protein ACOC1K_04390 [Nanoarchaeota archaeon]
MEEKDSKNEEEKKQDVSQEKTNNNEDKSENSLTDLLRNNVWIVSTIILILILVFVLVQSSMTGNLITGLSISESDAQSSVEDFLSSQIGDEFKITSIEDYNDYIYKINVLYDEQEIPLYVTKDGEYLAQLTPLDTEEVQNTSSETNTEPTQESSDSETDYSDNDLEKLTEFNDCLAEEGMAIYGSTSCPHCRNLVSMLGGYDAVENVYVECSQEGSQEDMQRCNEEAETGYVPEIQIDGELYEGDRTIEGFASETGCEAPQI